MYTKNLEEISKYLPNEDHFIVYGAGWTGYKFQYLLKILNKEIKYFILLRSKKKEKKSKEVKDEVKRR